MIYISSIIAPGPAKQMKLQRTLRETLQEAYLDWVNNFLTVEGFASYYGLHLDEAKDVIALGKKMYENKHPDE